MEKTSNKKSKKQGNKKESADNSGNKCPKCIQEIEELEKKVQELALTIDRVEDEKLEIENKQKKALADYINLEKSIDRRLQISLNQSKAKVAGALIEVMDDLNFAKEAAGKLKMSEEVKTWFGGIENTFEKMKNVLGNLDVELMDVKKGDDFDAQSHEAVGVVYEGGDNKVHEVVQQGYTMGENVVRPARVVVSKAKAEEN